MQRRVFGWETNGCFVRDHRWAARGGRQAVKDHAFLRERLGVMDLHARNYAFEPARSAASGERRAAASMPSAATERHP